MSEVNLIGLTKPSAYTGCFTAGELVAWAARVSNPSNQNNKKTAPRLLKYLIKHQHWSPLEIVHMAVEIKTTRDIARQILRHRSFSFQEYSQRYSDPTIDLNFVDREARLQDEKSKQASHEVNDYTLKEKWKELQRRAIFAAKEAYYAAREMGIAKEQARAVLPEGNTESVMIMAGSLRSWIHYCQLRMKWDTQKEHRIIAEQCWEVIKQHFPEVVEAIEELDKIQGLKDKVLALLSDSSNNEYTIEELEDILAQVQTLKTS